MPINGEPSLFLKRVMLFCMFFRFCSVFFCDSSQRFRKTRVEALKFWLPQYSTNRPPHQLSILIRFAMNQRLHKNSIDAVYIIDIKSHQNKAFTNLPQLIILYLLICIGPTQALAKGFKSIDLQTAPDLSSLGTPLQSQPPMPAHRYSANHASCSSQ